MTTWIHFGDVCGERLDIVHAVDALARPKDSRRKTFDSKCGVRVRLTGAPTKNGDVMTLPWPPYVSGAASIGFIRCGTCFDLTGKPKPCDMMGSPKWHKAQGTRYAVVSRGRSAVTE